MKKTCSVCDDEFDLLSPAKRAAGGLSTTCPDCSHEGETKYLGLQSGDGKGVGVTILAFDSPFDREEYRHMWRVNSGMTTGKSCQLMIQSRTPNVRFRKVSEAGVGVNHKGRA